jgi:Fe-Mn family superoxide dismutase
MEHALPPLPYPIDSLAPHYSRETLEYHHGKHHAAYVTNLNNLQKGTEFENMTLEEIIKKSSGGIYNNSAQVWNHTFFWNCMKPRGGGQPGGDLAKRIEQSFGGFDKFRDEFKQAAATQFGSGWAWLVASGGKLSITSTPNAVNPLAQGQTALLTCDVWEHAYYLDFQNRRPDFVQAFLDHLINWDFVAQNLAKAK